MKNMSHPIHIPEYPNLLLTKETFDGLGNKSLSEEAKKEILESFFLLSSYGTNIDLIGKRIKKTHRKGIWELKFKDKSKTEWRILFKKISRNEKPAKYGLLNMFRKTTQKLTKRDLDAAERIARREGW
ncbi:type II toxin-antitoxin system RelE/ParE family toxin [Bacillus amyloliquefaciens]|uniref:type II toxin-antitoxin system RelE/ParE family toxin n=1 Tax=Bacillus amyloliquefaciens TaxID=1390 RepID=UPI000F62E316|nr:type II toxin-antitoxin system RelE/ParE family toxin [Bacillus amyloliquefaciens]